MRNLLLLFVFVIMCSCVTEKKCSVKYGNNVTVHDSIYIERITKVPYYIKGDSILVEAPVNCPDQEVIIAETGKLKQIISILNGKLSSKTTIKPDTIFVDRIETIEKVKEVKVLDPVKYVPKLVKVLAWIGSISLFLILLYLASILRKLIGLKI